MAEKRDYYEVLGIDKSASPDQIKSAYRQMAKKYHPDLNKSPDAPAKFKEVQEAYEVLSDPQKKQAYDQFGFAAFDQNGQAGFQGQQGAGFGEGGFDADDLNDIFGQFFGGGSRRSSSNRSTPRKGNDHSIRVKLSFDQAVHGAKVDIPTSYVGVCPDCHGTGADSPSDVETCPTCHGQGHVRARRQTIFGTMETDEVCPTCGGSGKFIAHKCNRCHGTGKVRFNETLTVNIPHGVDTGDTICISGKGDAGSNGGPSGDLIIEVEVSPSSTFTRKGADVYINVPISVQDALLGCTVSVPSINGDMDLNIPSCTEGNTILKMRNQGIVLPSGKTGDEYVTISVKFPKKLSGKQIEDIEDFGNEEDRKGPFNWFKAKRKKK